MIGLPIVFLIFATGFISLVSQILILRELLILFGGIEVFLPVFFFLWLIGVSIGSFLLLKPTFKIFRSDRVLSILFVLLGLIIPLEILVSRLMLHFLKLQSPGMPDAYTMLSVCALAILPVSVLLGMMFVILSNLFVGPANITAIASGKSYIYVTLGSMAGGILLTFVLIQFFNPLSICAILLVLAAFGLLFIRKRLAPLLLIIMAFAIYFSPFLENESLKMQWKPFEVTEVNESPYGRITKILNDGKSQYYQNNAKVMPANGLMKIPSQNKFSFFLIVIGTVCLSFLVKLLAARNPVISRRMSMYQIMISGFVGFSLQLVIIIAFQSMHGTQYVFAGLLMALFMAGLSAGALVSGRHIESNKTKNFVIEESYEYEETEQDEQGQLEDFTEDTLFDYALGKPSFTLYLILISHFAVILFLTMLFAVQIQIPVYIFASMSFLAAIPAGAIFPVLVEIGRRKRLDLVSITGKYYSADLLGGAMGAAVTGLILIPSRGLVGALVVLLIFQLVSLFLSVES